LSIPDPGSRIPDPKTATKERGEKKHKIENYFNFELAVKKKIWANLQRIIELSTQTIVSSQKYGFGIRYPGSGENLFRIPDPGSKGQKGTGSRIRIRNTGNLSLSRLIYFNTYRDDRWLLTFLGSWRSG
jgi:hypothetical protein